MYDTETANYENEYKIIFKPSSSKVATSRNRLSECGYSGCENVEHIGGPKFSVCAKCRSTRYCSREHQVDDWKYHKAKCGETQEKERLADTTLASPGGPTHKQIIRNLLEDYIHLHDSTFHQIINWAYHDALRKMTTLDLPSVDAAVKLALKYRPDCNGNPAKAFALIDVKVIQVPDGMPEGVIDYTHRFNTNRKNDPTFIHGVVSLYTIMDYDSSYLPSPSMSWVGIYKPDAPFKLGRQWFDDMVKMLSAGVVLRKMKANETSKGVWVAGLLFQSDSKWIWKPLPPGAPAMFSVTLPPIEHWGRRKLNGVICAHGSDSEPWVAPKEYTWEEPPSMGAIRGFL